jgi:hypothetical protein
MNVNEHTGKEMRTGHASEQYVKGWELIFGKKSDEKNSSDTGHTSEAGSGDNPPEVVGGVHL